MDSLPPLVEDGRITMTARPYQAKEGEEEASGWWRLAVDWGRAEKTNKIDHRKKNA